MPNDPAEAAFFCRIGQRNSPPPRPACWRASTQRPAPAGRSCTAARLSPPQREKLSSRPAKSLPRSPCPPPKSLARRGLGNRHADYRCAFRVDGPDRRGRAVDPRIAGRTNLLALNATIEPPERVKPVAALPLLPARSKLWPLKPIIYPGDSPSRRQCANRHPRRGQGSWRDRQPGRRDRAHHSNNRGSGGTADGCNR